VPVCRKILLPGEKPEDQASCGRYGRLPYLWGDFRLDGTMKKQVWVGDEKPDPEKIEPLENREHFPKPKGGFWTSSLLGDASAWINWMTSEDWYNCSNPNAWLLTPEEDLKIYEINTRVDLMEITTGRDEAEFGGISLHPSDGFHLRYGYNYVDFEKVFAEYDAIHLTEEGQYKTRHSTPNLYGWDCETYLWDNWHFTDVEHMYEL